MGFGIIYLGIGYRVIVNFFLIILELLVIVIDVLLNN